MLETKKFWLYSGNPITYKWKLTIIRLFMLIKTDLSFPAKLLQAYEGCICMTI